MVMADREGVETASVPVTAVTLLGLAEQLTNSVLRLPFHRPFDGPAGPLTNLGQNFTRNIIRSFMGYSSSLPIEEFRSMERLLDGPQRYGDLQRDLGVPTNMLATRLRELEAAGVLTRLPLRHNTRAYALTDRGLALREAIVALGRWGAEEA